MVQVEFFEVSLVKVQAYLSVFNWIIYTFSFSPNRCMGVPK